MDNSSSDDSFLGRITNFFSPGPIPSFASGGGGQYAGGGASSSYEDPVAEQIAAASSDTESDIQIRTRPGEESPGARLFNPLGDYYSYTYQISLYMITPDAYDDFISLGRKNIELLSGPSAGFSKGVYLIAQSGGINNSTTTRAPGFELDYYIDNLKIKSKIAPQATGMAAQGVELTFDIIEPYGFSFISKLKQTADALMQYSNAKNIKSLKNPTRQFYILGVRFLGYDSEGQAVTNPEDMQERYWDININQIKFKIDGRVVNYAVTAVPIPVMVAFGTKRGMINKGASVRGATIEDMLSGNNPEAGIYGLFAKLNDDERNIPNVTEYNTYSVEFLGEDGQEIAKSTIVTDADLNKSKMPMGNAKKTSEVNVKLEVKAVPNVNARQITFKNDTPIVQAIQQLISQSTYLIETLKQVYTTDNEPDAKTNAPKSIKPNTQKYVKWYMITTRAQNPRYDTTRGDFVFDITYVIQSYNIPIVLTNAKTTPYYGPVKRYEYWYTGKNSEILRYEQTLDNTYVVNVVDPSGDKKQTGGDANIPTSDKRANVSRLGQNNQGADASNQILTQLLDPKSWANAKIEILGDPDFLIQPSIAITAGAQSTEFTGSILDKNPFHGLDGFVVNPNHGQVFIEIDFKEGVDYDTNNGTMEINDQISLYTYPPEIKSKLKGVSYLVYEVTSYFRGGKFTQELACNVNPFAGSVGKDSDNQRAETNQTNSVQSRTGVDLTNTSAGGGRGFVQPGTAATSSESTSARNGLTPVAPVSINSTATPQIVSTTTASGSQTATTATGQVSDDDGNLPASYTPII